MGVKEGRLDEINSECSLILNYVALLFQTVVVDKETCWKFQGGFAFTYRPGVAVAIQTKLEVLK